jgi:hypothetical protein
MFARIASLALATVALGSTDAFGQVYYGGYHLGPDYGQLINQQMAEMNNTVRMAQQRANEAVEKAMQDPRCRAMHQQHLQQGGRTSLRDFAYWYVATAGGTPEGARRYMNSEFNNQAKEKAAVQGLWDAQQKSRQAMAAWQQGYFNNQVEAGNILSGNMTYTGSNGQQYVLPYIQPGYYLNPQTGVLFHLDQFGRYHMQDTSGNWTELYR